MLQLNKDYGNNKQPSGKSQAPQPDFNRDTGFDDNAVNDEGSRVTLNSYRQPPGRTPLAAHNAQLPITCLLAHLRMDFSEIEPI